METTVQRIKRYIDKKGISVRTFEKSIGFSNGSFASQFKNNKTIGIDKVENILQYYTDINPTWLLTGKGSMLIVEESSDIGDAIPIYDAETTAGSVVLFQDMTEVAPVGYINIPNLPKCDGAIKVVGDSMYPIIKSGDLVIYKIVDCASSIIFGEMYLVDFTLGTEDYLMTKYVKKAKSDDNILLVSYNKHHDDLEIPKSSVRNIALIKANIRFNLLK